MSDQQRTIQGVSQGSVSGPLCFLLSVGDLLQDSRRPQSLCWWCNWICPLGWCQECWRWISYQVRRVSNWCLAPVHTSHRQQQTDLFVPSSLIDLAWAMLSCMACLTHFWKSYNLSSTMLQVWSPALVNMITSLLSWRTCTGCQSGSA